MRPTGKYHVSIEDSIRHQLIVLARRKEARITAFSALSSDRVASGRSPQPRRNVRDALYRRGPAWEFIASRLETGENVDVVELRQPPEQERLRHED